MAIEVYICFEKPWCTTEDCCCGEGVACVDEIDWGTLNQYAIFRGGARWESSGRPDDGTGITSSDVSPLTFNYLTSQAASLSWWDGGVHNTTRWSTAWLMPGYAKFFESETSENYKMRVMTFRGWAHSGDVYSSGWAKGTVKPNRSGKHLGYQFTNIGRNWNNISWNLGSSNDDRESSAHSLDTTSGGDRDVEGNRTRIFNTAKKVDNELAAVMANGKYMLISRTTFYDREQSDAESSIGKFMNMPWPLCRIGPATTQQDRMQMTDSVVTGRLGLGAANPLPAMDEDGQPISVSIDSSAKAYAVVYNPEELKGLIERFGPYEYYRLATGEFIAGEWIGRDVGEFVVDRRTISRIKFWYDHHTSKVEFGSAIAGDPSAAIFRKIKSPAYKKSDLYTLGREVETTTTATTLTSTAPTVAASPPSTTGGGGMGGGGTGGY